MTYQEVLDFLYSQLPMYQRVGKKALNHDLGKTIEIHERLGNPQHSFKSVHIAGTNGKGTTAHMLASILSQAGYKVGLYTSPHLKSFRERIRINGEMISEEYIISFVENHSSIVKDVVPSFFEMTVAMAYEYFASQKVDIAVIETGLGGRLDSTNIITPEVSVITSIGLDHQDILGSTIHEIAQEKAGIIKENVPVVVGKVDEEALNAISVKARHMKAKLFVPGIDISVQDRDGMIEVTKNEKEYLPKILCDLKGDSPLLNLPVTLKAIECLVEKGFNIDTEHLIKGIENVCKNTQLLGRWQILSESPLTICDIGHNESAVEILMERLRAYKKQIHIVWGMNSDKSIEDILALLPCDAKYYFCAAKIDRALSAESLMDRANKLGLRGKAHGSVMQAYNEALHMAMTEDVLFIGGSTFVLAELENLI